MPSWNAIISDYSKVTSLTVLFFTYQKDGQYVKSGGLLNKSSIGMQATIILIQEIDKNLNNEFINQHCRGTGFLCYAKAQLCRNR